MLRAVLERGRFSVEILALRQNCYPQTILDRVGYSASDRADGLVETSTDLLYGSKKLLFFKLTQVNAELVPQSALIFREASSEYMCLLLV